MFFYCSEIEHFDFLYDIPEYTVGLGLKWGYKKPKFFGPN